MPLPKDADVPWTWAIQRVTPLCICYSRPDAVQGLSYKKLKPTDDS